MKRITRSLAPVLALLPLALVVPAQAAPPVAHELYEGSDVYEFEVCGLAVRNEVSFSGNFMLKAPRSDGAPPYFMDNYDVVESWTVEGSDRVLTFEHNGVYKDIKITHVEGTVYRFDTLEAGQPYVIRDESGRVLLRDRGAIRWTFLVDTKGDTDLSNDVFLEEPTVVTSHGPHPGLYRSDEDFCTFLEGYFLG